MNTNQSSRDMDRAHLARASMIMEKEGMEPSMVHHQQGAGVGPLLEVHMDGDNHKVDMEQRYWKLLM